jgi:hypothetical protein
MESSRQVIFIILVKETAIIGSETRIVNSDHKEILMRCLWVYIEKGKQEFSKFDINQLTPQIAGSSSAKRGICVF